ncbi:nitrous oxide reductase family maturation protein NosD [Microbacterium testaceum]|uniref:right-handed parallel beta-helix repeat-containing protein n=1 Tax=Microbacterium testaceum TaxID=2033 RepID=UPI0037F28D60
MLNRPRLSRTLAALFAATAVATSLTACAPTGSAPAAQTVRVPEDAATIGEAVSRVAEGGLILVGPGTYAEQVLIDKPNVTLRGTDRNETVIDGGGVRSYGVVAVADGISVENLTVARTTFYGVLVTGLHDENGPSAHGVDGYTHLDPAKFPPIERFSIDHVTAYDNGLYGLYAFDAHNGVIRDSYASGSADSGIYVGQCVSCGILVTGNVAENNAVGFENANASDSVWIVGNRFSGNRVGMTLLSNYQEAFTPQRANVVAGNLISENARSESPAQADGGFGVGLGIGGGTQNAIENNRIEGNPRAGVLLTGNEDLSATGNIFSGTIWGDNGVDLANVSSARAQARANCVSDGSPSTLPIDLLATCPDGVQTAVAPDALPAVDVPPGMSFLKVAAPPPQPSMSDVEAPARVLPTSVSFPDRSTIGVPAADLFAERARR